MTAPTRPKPGQMTFVGLREIAKLLEVEPRTPTIWRNRSHRGDLVPPMPEPQGYVSGNRPIWDRKVIMAWAKETGRLPSQKRAKVAAKDAATAE